MSAFWCRWLGISALTGVLGACLPDSSFTELEDTTLTEIVAVGVLQGAEEEEFGRISEVRARGDGSFFVLDGQAGTVAWFDVSGGYIDGLRSRGAGPGELEAPSALAVSSTSQLLVLDPPNGRINVYRVEGRDLRYQYQMTSYWSPLGLNRNLCSVGDRWFVRGPRGGYTTHEIDGGGEVISSFSEAEPVSVEEFGPFVEIVVPQLNAGQLLCLEDERAIVTVGAMSSRVRTHTSEGELVWEVEVPEIHMRRFVLRDRALGTQSDVEEGFHQIRSLVQWSPESILVQYSWHPVGGSPEGQDFHSIESVELAVSDGLELGRTDRLPLIADTQGNLVYSFENLPYPRARVFERQD